MKRLTVLDIADLMGDCRDDVIFNGLVKTNSIINNPKYENIMCSISGGSDSDIMLDICCRLDVDNKIKYVWFDTGLEYQATKDHLEYLEKRYGIEIIREKAIKSIPYSVKNYGQPFINKRVSQFVGALQNKDFQWENQPYEILKQKYKKADSYLKWWCNENPVPESRHGTMFNINFNSGLKEFIMENPPTFPISAFCCKYAKKDVSKKYVKEHKIDLVLMGIRKSEGGIRSIAYKNCYSETDVVDYHRPIFYYTDENKMNYEKVFGVTHSRCYTLYGMTRTGCGGCPFNKNIGDDIRIIEKYEPKLFKAINNIFSDTYEYTRKYREFQKEMKHK